MQIAFFFRFDALFFSVDQAFEIILMTEDDERADQKSTGGRYQHKAESQLVLRTECRQIITEIGDDQVYTGYSTAQATEPREISLVASAMIRKVPRIIRNTRQSTTSIRALAVTTLLPPLKP